MSLPRPATLSHLLRAQSHQATTFTYNLPPHRIARHPTSPRSASKLLIAPHDHPPLHKHFHDLPHYLPPHSLLILNSSRVIPARIPLQKATGGRAELLLLNPETEDASTALGSDAKGQRWRAVIGGRRISQGDRLSNDDFACRVVEKNGQDGVVEVESEGVLGGVLDVAGQMPLPPYLDREVEEGDCIDYQTVYARCEGSVAAPTAGLHVTEDVLEEIVRRDVDVEEVVLHVGAGTFLPVKTNTGEHEMHEERVQVSMKVVEKLKRQIQHDRPVIAMGTTCVRTLESLYWYGVQLLHTPNTPFDIPQWLPYETLDTLNTLPPPLEALTAITETHPHKSITGRTSLLIVPGYPFKLTTALITNFHQPQSTLLMLVSAFHGGPPSSLFQIYQQALQHNYRFLSYGDSSLYCPTSFIYHN